MIKKYDKFIIESLITSMILEANIQYNDDFNTLLKSLREQSGSYDEPVVMIATFLIGLVSSNIDISQNYIGLSDEVDKISFTPDNKINYNSISYRDSNVIRFEKSPQDIILTAGIPIEGLILSDEINSNDIPNDWKLINTYDMNDINNNMYTDYTLYYLQSNTYPDKFIVCYSTKGSLSPIMPNIEEGAARGKLKIGRYVNRLLDLYFKDKIGKVAIGEYSYKSYKDRGDYKASDIEKFVNAFISAMEFNKNAFNYLSVIKGEEVKKWYSSKNYLNDLGELGQSCMRYGRCQDYFDIYVENPDVCSLLILKDPNEDKIHGRALLWILSDGTKYMDRVYTNKNGLDGLFNKWSVENDYNLKYSNINSSEISVKVKAKDYVKYPYMDTFKYYNKETSILSSDSHYDSKVIKLASIDGGYN
jgi:hypothetical protein